MDPKNIAEKLFELVKSSRFLMQNFNKKAYKKNFERYLEICQTIAGTLSEESVRKAAADFVELLSADHNTNTKRKRDDASLLDKMQIVSYLFPAMEKTENETAHRLCEAICEEWKKNYPREEIAISTYENIMSGFGVSFLGIRLW